MSDDKPAVKIEEYQVRMAIRDNWKYGVHVWEWLDAPDCLQEVPHPFGEDARRLALVPRVVWRDWQRDEDLMPWWMWNLGGAVDETTGLPNISWHEVGEDWVVVVGRK